MSKKSRMTLMIVVPVIGVLLVFVAILSMFVKEEEEVIRYPAGNLSDSIFESQNTQYVESSLLTGKHEFDKVPYTIDTVNAERAKVGNGSVYVQGDYYLYYSEISKTDTMGSAVLSELSQILNYGVDESKCSLNKIRTEEGFLNGFRVLYEISELTVPGKGKNGTKTAYVLSYRLEINNDDIIRDKHDIVIGAVTELLSNDTLLKCKQLLDLSIYTVQYDSSLAKDIENAIEDGTLEGEIIGQDKNNGASNDKVTGSDSDSETTGIIEGESTESMVGGVLTNEPQDEKEKTMGILLKQDYVDLTIVVDWTNPDAAPVLEFCDVREEETYTPATTEKGRAVFYIGSIEAGVYMVTIKDWEDAGAFTCNLVGE